MAKREVRFTIVWSRQMRVADLLNPDYNDVQSCSNLTARQLTARIMNASKQDDIIIHDIIPKLVGR